MHRKKKKKIMFIFGTRPEAIKMVPLIKQFRTHQDMFESIIVVTAQHREMLDQILRLFNVKPNYDLNVMRADQTLEDVTIRCLKKLSEVIELELPNMILVQGDTTTTFIGALAAYYKRIPIGHIEAGLRSDDKYQPFPEEINRKLTTVLTDIHFAPTQSAADNLLRGGVPIKNIFVTGNTVIDALLQIASRNYKFRDPLDKIINNKKRLIMVTAHRRESFGKPLEDICIALEEIVKAAPDVEIVFPVHPNPRVNETVYRNVNNNHVHLVRPLDYETFIHLMKECCLILTDSGGIQEEAPSLGKPVLVLREKTERPEAIEAGVAKLIGTNRRNIIIETLKLLTNPDEYERMAKPANPYGDGRAAERIFRIIRKEFDKSPSRLN